MSGHHILVGAYSLPQHDRDSGGKRAFDLIALLQQAGWTVSFFSPKRLDARRYAADLQRQGVGVFEGDIDLLDQLLHEVAFDLVLCIGWPLAELCLPSIRRLSPSTRVIVDSVDLHLLSDARRIFRGRSAVEPRLLGDEYAAEMIGELNTYAAADGVLAVSAVEADLINGLIGDLGLTHAIPLLEELPFTTSPLAERRGALFLGSFRHPPNVEAVAFLCRQVLPRLDPALRERLPLQIVGDGLSEAVRAYGQGLPLVRMIGWVPSIQPYFERARLSVVPLLYGAGTKGKLIQALMAGTPTVTTSIGAEGLDLRDGEHVLIADDADGFATAIARLIEDEPLAHALAERARAHVAAIHGRDVVMGHLLQAIAQVMARAPKPPVLLAEDGERRYHNRLLYLYEHQVAARLVATLDGTVPSGATVIVATGGSTELRWLDGRDALPFPQGEDGHHPGRDEPRPQGRSAITHLEALRAKGGQYLVFPETQSWWLDHDAELDLYLANRYDRLSPAGDDAVVFDLRQPKPPPNELRLIAFYLPQYHPIPENDAWWGPGFTEWTNVTRARPLFPGHEQPHLPTELGFYDLRLAETRARQAALARDHGLFGFCYYHYWFGGKRLLQRPFEEVLATGQPDFPFCLCWANEPWSRRWHGLAEDLLQDQNYSEADDLAHITWLLPALRDPRAITIDGRPVFLVYRADDLPHPGRTTAIWRREVERAGLPGIYLIAVETGWDTERDATEFGFDAKVLFQPQFSHLFATTRIPIDGSDDLRVYNYQDASVALSNPAPAPYLRYDTVFPSWDNTARTGGRGVVLHNSTPAAYEAWLRRAADQARRRLPDYRIVFVNAWNEWGEGCHLEPDARHGHAYLEATRHAVYLPDESIRVPDDEDESPSSAPAGTPPASTTRRRWRLPGREPRSR